MGISQEVLAEHSNLHRTYITEVESGRRNVTLKTMERLARALKVSMSTLLMQSDPCNEPDDPARRALSTENADNPAFKP